MSKTVIVGLVCLIVVSFVLADAKELEQKNNEAASTIGTYTLSADHISYDPGTQTIRLKGNARMVSNKNSISADSIAIHVGDKNNLRIQLDGITAQLSPTLTDLGNGVAVPTKSITEYAEQHNISFKEAFIRIKKESELYFFPLSPIPRGSGIGDIPERGLHIEPSPLNEELRPR